MGKRVKGITVEIGGNTTKLNKALEGTNKHLGSTQASLKDVVRLLKLDPTNTQLLEQKQRLLSEAVSDTKDKLDVLRQANEKVADSVKNYDAWKAAYDPLQEEITTTNKKLKDLKAAQKEMEDCGEIDTDEYKHLRTLIDDLSEDLVTLKEQAKAVNEEFGNPISQDEYDALQREIIETEQQLENLKTKTKEFGSVGAQQAAYVGEQFEKAGKKIADVGEKISDVGEKLLPVTTAVIASGTACITTADSLETAANSFLAATGTAAEGMETLSDGTQGVIDNTEKFKDVIDEIYRNNYGESFEDIAQAMATVKSNLSNIDDSQLRKVTESAIALQDTFDMDVSESIRAVNSLMDQFGVTADEAYSLIVQGAQKGLNQNGDLLDVINEYSVQFKSIGYDAEDMFNMLANGAEEGTWSIDKLGDAVKEFNIRMSDGSAKDAVEALGYSWKEVSEAWSKGGQEAKETMFVLMDNLWTARANTDIYSAGVGLLGTMFEDLGYDAVMALSNTNGEISKTNDAMAALKQQRYDDLTSQIQQLGRTFISDVAVPIGERLIPIVSQIIEKVSEWIEEFGELSSEGQALVITVAAIVAAIGPALIAIGSITTGFSKVTTSIGSVLQALPKLQSTFSSVIGFIAANPVVLLIAAIVGLVALIGAKGDEMQATLQRFDTWLQGVFATDWTKTFGPVLGGALNSFFSTAKGIWDSLKQILDGVIDFIRGVFTGDWERAWSGVVSIFSGIFSGIQTLAKKPINAVISLVNSAIGAINSLIGMINKIPGVNIGSIGKIPMMASGGTLFSGDAIVGEAGPELLTVSGGKAVVRPLGNSSTTNNTANFGNTTINVYAQPGQDVHEIATEVAEILGDDAERKAAVFGE